MIITRIFNRLGFVLFMSAVSAGAGVPDASSVSDLAARVTNSTLPEFVRSINSNKWEAPVIFSRWHVEQVATNSPARQAAALEFGRTLAVRLDQWAAAMAATAQTEDAARLTTSLLDLADWLHRSPGYGNLVLGSACLGTAQVGIGRMLVDTNWPVPSATAAVKRLNKVSAVPPSVRMRMLNGEAGAAIFAPISSNEVENQQALERIWQTGALEMVRDSVETRGLVDSRRPLPRDIQIALQRYRANATPLILRHQDFFQDDRMPVSLNTPASLEIKWHRRFTFDAPVARPLQALADFRSAVGYFPLSYVFTEAELRQRADELKHREAIRKEWAERGTRIIFDEQEDDALLIAFDRAWQAVDPNGGPAGLAMRAYLDIKSGLPQATNDVNPRVRIEAWRKLVQNGNREGVFKLTEYLPGLDKQTKEGVLNSLMTAAFDSRMEFNRSTAAWTNNEVLAAEWISWWNANKHRYVSNRSDAPLR